MVRGDFLMLHRGATHLSPSFSAIDVWQCRGPRLRSNHPHANGWTVINHDCPSGNTVAVRGCRQGHLGTQLPPRLWPAVALFLRL
jgi:hypothetical protein